MGIAKYIPNTITSMNLVCGLSGIICTFAARFDLAFYFMLGGAVLDFSDGLAARALGAVSSIGKELDSLCDVVTFGLLPALMLYKTMTVLRGVDFWCYVPLVLAVFSALRLAKFNIDDRQTVNFIGLATPASALLCGALAHYVALTPDSFLVGWAGSRLCFPLLSLCLSALLVSEIPMFSLKFKKGVQRDSIIYRLRIGFFGICVACAIFVILVGQKFSLVIILSILAYILDNVILRLVMLSKGK